MNKCLPRRGSCESRVTWCPGLRHWGNLLQPRDLLPDPRHGTNQPLCSLPHDTGGPAAACSQDCLSCHNSLKVALFFLIVAINYFEN